MADETPIYAAAHTAAAERWQHKQSNLPIATQYKASLDDGRELQHWPREDL